MPVSDVLGSSVEEEERGGEGRAAASCDLRGVQPHSNSVNFWK